MQRLNGSALPIFRQERDGKTLFYAPGYLALVPEPQAQAFEQSLRVVAGHLSEKNNRPDLVVEALLGVSRDLEPRVTVLGQDSPSGWLAV